MGWGSCLRGSAPAENTWCGKSLDTNSQFSRYSSFYHQFFFILHIKLLTTPGIKIFPQAKAVPPPHVLLTITTTSASMAILSYWSVTSTATPISQDSSTTPLPNPRQTKVILPKKKPMKWSTGLAPGEYGGPPTTSKLRKYWGGEDEDPLTSDDYIWNKDFMGRMKRLIQDYPDDSSSPFQPTAAPAPAPAPSKVITFSYRELMVSDNSNVYLVPPIWIAK